MVNVHVSDRSQSWQALVKKKIQYCIITAWKSNYLCFLFKRTVESTRSVSVGAFNQKYFIVKSDSTEVLKNESCCERVLYFSMNMICFCCCQCSFFETYMHVQIELKMKASWKVKKKVMYMMLLHYIGKLKELTVDSGHEQHLPN